MLSTSYEYGFRLTVSDSLSSELEVLLGWRRLRFCHVTLARRWIDSLDLCDRHLHVIALTRNEVKDLTLHPVPQYAIRPAILQRDKRRVVITV